MSKRTTRPVTIGLGNGSEGPPKSGQKGKTGYVMFERAIMVEPTANMHIMHIRIIPSFLSLFTFLTYSNCTPPNFFVK